MNNFRTEHFPLLKSVAIMGNVLESDYSVSETEDGPGIHEERSQGDGRESDDAVETHTQQAAMKSIPKVESVTQGNQQKFLPAELKNGYNRIEIKKESPRQLPPKGQLIPLRPVRLPEANYCTNNEFPINKQSRDPKFVPYEPYAGAVRSMVEDGSSKRLHSRRPSNSSTVSGSSITQASGGGISQSVQQYSADSEILINHINHFKNQTHSVTLMKERLKIAEKDISDLQAENARLKKLMVDSMTGTVGSDTSYNTSGEPLGTESFDNLNDEIEVWRSKFLSSCVLVDQLSKENRDMKMQISAAANLFREIKNTAGLTPGLYDQINYWLNRNALGINQFDYNYNSTNNDGNSNDYDCGMSSSYQLDNASVPRS